MKKIYLLIFVLSIIQSCKKKIDIFSKSSQNCFGKIETEILNKNEIINFNDKIDCIQWDYLEIVDLTSESIKNFLNFNFMVINDEKHKRLLNEGYVGYDGEYWSYVFFYNKEKILTDAIAINNEDFYLQDFYNRNKKIKREDAVFKTKKEYFKISHVDSIIRFRICNPR